MAELVKLHKDSDLGKRIPVFDGRRTLYTAGLLPFNAKDFSIVLADDDEWIGITKYLSSSTFCSVYILINTCHFIQMRFDILIIVPGSVRLLLQSSSCHKQTCFRYANFFLGSKLTVLHKHLKLLILCSGSSLLKGEFHCLFSIATVYYYKLNQVIYNYLVFLVFV